MFALGRLSTGMTLHRDSAGPCVRLSASSVLNHFLPSETLGPSKGCSFPAASKLLCLQLIGALDSVPIMTDPTLARTHGGAAFHTISSGTEGRRIPIFVGGRNVPIGLPHCEVNTPRCLQPECETMHAWPLCDVYRAHRTTVTLQPHARRKTLRNACGAIQDQASPADPHTHTHTQDPTLSVAVGGLRY